MIFVHQAHTALEVINTLSHVLLDIFVLHKHGLELNSRVLKANSIHTLVRPIHQLVNHVQLAKSVTRVPKIRSRALLSQIVQLADGVHQFALVALLQVVVDVILVLLGTSVLRESLIHLSVLLVRTLVT